MTSEIVFHIGDPKTGSTAIQETLATKAFRCPTRRVLYPARLHHIPLAKTFYVPRKAGQKAEQMRCLAKAVAASDADVAVVSAEAFSHVDPADLKAAIDKWLPGYSGRIRLIAYVRPHAERLLSGFAERSKQGIFRGTLEELHQVFLRTRTLIYTPRFERWRATFGEAFELRPMIRNRLKDRDVVSDFLDFALSGAPVELAPGQRSNESLTLQDLVILREFHARARACKANKPACIAFGWHFARTLAANPPAGEAGRLQLHRGLAEEVVAAYEADAQALDAAFFEGTPMTDALQAVPDRAVESPQSLDAEELLGPDRLRLVRQWTDLTLIQIAGDPHGFVERLREAQFRALGIPEEPPAPPPPLPARIARRVRRELGGIVARVRA